MSVTPASSADGQAQASGGGRAAVQSTGAGGAAPGAAIDSCPLCRAPLADEQDWCLRCGAPARTRLAPSRKRKTPIVALAIVATLSLGVLAAAVVKLASNSTAAPAATATYSPSEDVDIARVMLSIEQTVLTHRHLHTKISCPSVVPLEAGRTFTCIARSEAGQATPFRVTEQNASGAVTFVGE
jgi:hypothetical protein